jgi:hypothetical protein
MLKIVLIKACIYIKNLVDLVQDMYVSRLGKRGNGGTGEKRHEWFRTFHIYRQVGTRQRHAG